MRRCAVSGRERRGVEGLCFDPGCAAECRTGKCPGNLLVFVFNSSPSAAKNRPLLIGLSIRAHERPDSGEECSINSAKNHGISSIVCQQDTAFSVLDWAHR